MTHGFSSLPPVSWDLSLPGARRVLPRRTNPSLGFQVGRREIRSTHVHATLSGGHGCCAYRAALLKLRAFCGCLPSLYVMCWCGSWCDVPGFLSRYWTGPTLPLASMFCYAVGQGTISKGDVLFNLNSGKKLKVPRLVRMHSADMEVRHTHDAECSRRPSEVIPTPNHDIVLHLAAQLEPQWMCQGGEFARDDCRHAMYFLCRKTSKL